MTSKRADREHLRRVQAVTDAALAHLSLELLLDELLLRVRDLLNADTAATLLINDTGNELVATAAKGLEAEVQSGVRLPIGGGFAGKIAATGKPVILDDVDHTKVLNPILLEHDIRSMLGVPLIANGEVVGVLHVGTLQPRIFTEQDVEILQLVADRVALAVKAKQQERERMIATTLQRSLLPEALPYIEDIDIAVRYLPAEGGLVGGDWYDVFALPSGTLCIVVGDVVGRGLAAAVAMARLRNSVRALAFVDAQPEGIVGYTNELLLHFDPDVMATMLVGVLETDGSLTYASAGHLPPLVIDADRHATYADRPDEPGEPALGAVAFHRYRARHLTLEPGSSLVLYTDGLVERRDQPLDKGLEDLRTSLETTQMSNAESIVEHLAGSKIVERRREDDLAVVVVRYLGAPPSSDFHIIIPASSRELARLRRRLRGWLDQLSASEQAGQDVVVAVGEAVANSIEHAYAPGRGVVRIDGHLADRQITITVADEGKWRDARGRDRGRGHQLMEATMDSVEVVTNDNGTVITMAKHLGPGDDNGN